MGAGVRELEDLGDLRSSQVSVNLVREGMEDSGRTNVACCSDCSHWSEKTTSRDDPVVLSAKQMKNEVPQFPCSIWRAICDEVPAGGVMRLVLVCRSLSRLRGLPLNWCDNDDYRIGDYVGCDWYVKRAPLSTKFQWEGLRLLECDDQDLRKVASLFPKLKHLDTAFANMKSLADLQPVRKSMRRLILKNASSLTTVSGLVEFFNLRLLTISWSADLAEIALSDANFRSLTEVSLYQCQSLSKVSALPKSLLKLSIGCPASLVDISAVGNCSNLVRCDLTWCSSIKDISQLAECKKLRSCDLAHCSSLVDVSPLSHLQVLEELNLSHCSMVADVASLSRCSSLVDLKLVGCPEIRDLTALCDCRNLCKLDSSFCNVAVTSLNSLVQISQIISV